MITRLRMSRTIRHIRFIALALGLVIEAGNSRAVNAAALR
jgi:hypothetical protein